MIRRYDFFSTPWQLLRDGPRNRRGRRRRLTIRDLLELPGYFAPPTTARGTPTGNAMTDGFPVKIACVNAPTISFWEKAVMEPGIDGGDPIPTSTMFNVKWHTAAPRVLLKSTDATGTAAYEPAVLTQILAQINVPQGWTVTFPNGDTYSWWGWLQSFVPDTNEEGKQPEAKFKVNVSNVNPTSGAEEGPVLVSAGGT